MTIAVDWALKNNYPSMWIVLSNYKVIFQKSVWHMITEVMVSSSLPGLQWLKGLEDSESYRGLVIGWNIETEACDVG